MRLSCALRVSNPLLQDVLGFLDELSMEIYGVAVDAADGVVFPEDVVGRLLIVLFHHGTMSLAFLGEFVRCCSIASIVRLMGLEHHLRLGCVIAIAIARGGKAGSLWMIAAVRSPMISEG